MKKYIFNFKKGGEEEIRKMKIPQLPSSCLDEISTAWINAGLETADVTVKWKVQWDYLFRQRSNEWEFWEILAEVCWPKEVIFHEFGELE